MAPLVWMERLEADDIAAIYERYSIGQSFTEDCSKRFGYPLDEENLNKTHQIIIVAGELDASIERVIAYLNARDIPINVLFFQVFQIGAKKFLSRTWLVDPTDMVMIGHGTRDGSMDSSQLEAEVGTRICI